MLSIEERQGAAATLAAAERDRAPIEPLTTRWPELDVVDAYEIQLLNIRSRAAAGANIVGHKVGLSSQLAGRGWWCRRCAHLTAASTSSTSGRRRQPVREASS